MLELKRVDPPEFRQMLEFIASPFPFSSERRLNLAISCRNCAGVAKKCTRKRDASAKLLFSSLNPLFFGVPTAVATIVS